MHRLSLFTVMLLIFTACVKEVSWPLQKELPPVIIVDGVITDEVKAHRVMITRPVSGLNLEAEPVAGAGVLISNEDSTWQLTEHPQNSGIYVTPAHFFAQLEKTYTLLITVNGGVYTAKASMTGGSLFRELVVAREEDKNLYYVDWVANAFSTETAAMWELLIDWSTVPGYEGVDSLNTHARLLFYTLPTLDVSEVFAPEMQTVLFPAGTIITERRYSLTPQHAEFIREMLLETNWTGGLFPVAPANAGTNLSAGAYGYFGASAVTELSVIVTP